MTENVCYIHQITLVNFKSYKGHHAIGPFSQFTSIIGPNGAGKSNILDAISFVLGIQARHIRGHTLSDLIYRPSRLSGQEEAPSFASVALHLRFKDSGQDLIFSRHVSQKTSHSTFKIDNETVSAETYQEKLAEINILVKARNFLIFQGDIVDVATKSPPELGKLFEEVSRSSDLAAEYEAKEEEVKTVSSQLTQLVLKRQRLGTQLQDLKKQVSEAQQYREFEGHVAEASTQLIGYKLYVNEVRAGQLRQQLEENDSSISEVKSAQETLQKTLRQSDATIAKIRLKRSQIENEINVVESQLQDTRLKIAGIEEKLNFAKQQSAELQKKADLSYLKEQRIRSKLEEYEDSLKVAEERIRELNREHEVAQKERIIPVEIEKEYTKLKQLAAAESISRKGSLLNAQNRKKTVEAKLSALRSEIEAAHHQKSQVEEQLLDVTANEAQAREDLESLRNEMSEVKKEEQEANSRMGEKSKAFERARNERQKVEEELTTIQANQYELERAQRQSQIVAKLQNVFPKKVHGVLLSLCKPASRRYASAITVALGKLADAIVVDSFATAKQAVQYLKNNRLGAMDFAPLDTIKRSPVDPRLKSIKQFGCRSAIDCVQFDTVYEPVFLSALHDSVIVDSLDSANRLAYEECPRLGLRLKVITTDGEKILKNGNISVDFSGGSSGVRFDTEKAVQLAQRLREIESDLANLIEEKSLIQRKADQLKAKFECLKNTILSKESKVQMWTKRKELLIGVVKETTRLAEVAEKQITDSTTEFQKSCAAVEEAERGVEEAEKKSFEPLTKKGFDVSAIQKAERARATRASEREDELSQQKLRMRRLGEDMEQLAQQLKELDTAGIRAGVLKASKAISQEESALAKERGEEHSFKVKKDSLTESLKALEAELSSESLRTKRHRAELDELNKRLGELTTLVERQTLQSEALLKEALLLLKKAIFDGLDTRLPLLNGTAQDFKRLLGINSDQPNASEEEAMTDDTDTSQQQLPEIDYETLLTPALRDSCGSDESVRANLHRLEQAVGAAQSALQQFTPNMKSEERYASVVSALKEVDKETSSIAEQKEKASRSFLDLRRRRNRKFMSCFRHVQKSISTVYNALTGGDSDQSYADSRLGGQAFLELCDPSSVDLFSSGIIYNVMPPSKRFCDLKRLSGGERTLAALALIFALQQYRPASFLVLDEIDADLDSANISTLAHYLSTSSKQYQVIVISHADRVFGAADKLIGVYVNVDKETSQVVTLDLTTYQS